MAQAGARAAHLKPAEQTPPVGTRAGAPYAPQTEERSALTWGVRARAYYELTKPGIAIFVVMTAGVSFYVASRGRPEVVPLVVTLLATLLATSGALALNQWWERDPDREMERTRHRPIPSGRLTAPRALAFGVALVVAGVALQAGMVGWLSAILLASSAAAYVLVYTPLKKRTHHAALVGGVPGAMPALIGWSAGTGGISAGGLALFAIAFFWQLPHVLALAWMFRADYETAGFVPAPRWDREGRWIARHMIIHSAILLPVSLLPTFLYLTGFAYLIGAVFLGMLLLGAAVEARRRMDRGAARRVFLGTLLYQPLLLGLMLLDTVRV